jgi:beta-galactosidase
MKMTYYVYGSGDIVVSYTLNPDGSKSYLPNVGTLFTVPGGYEKVRWFGRGPDENYMGRNRGSFMGLYSTVADSMTVKYMEIGETGQRTDVKWATLTNNDGKGLMIVGNPRMEFSAQHYTPEQLSNVKLPWELKRDKDITLRVDLHQMGVGGINSWGAQPLDAYLLKANREYSHTFRLAPIRQKLNDPTEYSLLGFRNFGWNKEIAPAKYGETEIKKIYENQPDKDITEDAYEDTEGRTPILPSGVKMANNAVRDYSVFDMQGRLVAKFTTVGIEDLQAKTTASVKRSGTYLVKTKTGTAYRINVK